ncbi:sugar phosphate isomerase/epimerase family protein [Propionivibrio limicola]|uniref:sugar phosphate isomerase/epimerase family protein n=1 Tax=Propionivibrio limicola TaxID=167645 RepID=UPI0012922E91|nr:sugar phosphate isomerase/epimerase [Propionivibrio limicola]
MKRQFSLVYLTASELAPPEMIETAGRAGFDYVSLRTIAMGLPGELNFGLSSNPALLRDTKAALADSGVKLLDIENARLHDDVDIRKYLPEMEIAAELGAKAVLTNIWSTDRAFVVDKFAELCGHAKSYGLKVNLEFVTWASITDLKDSVEIIKSSGADNAAIALDTLHFSRSRCTLEELAALPPDYLGALHLCDAPAEIPTTKEGLIHTGRGERLYVGEGGIDIAGIVSNMPANVVCGIEIPHIERLKAIGASEHISRSIETTKAYLEANGL